MSDLIVISFKLVELFCFNAQPPHLGGLRTYLVRGESSAHLPPSLSLFLSLSLSHIHLLIIKNSYKYQCFI